MTKNNAIEKCLRSLSELETNYQHDPEAQHYRADHVLIELLKDLGINEVAKVYEKMSNNFYYFYYY